MPGRSGRLLGTKSEPKEGCVQPPEAGPLSKPEPNPTNQNCSWERHMTSRNCGWTARLNCQINQTTELDVPAVQFVMRVSACSTSPVDHIAVAQTLSQYPTRYSLQKDTKSHPLHLLVLVPLRVAIAAIATALPRRLRYGYGDEFEHAFQELEHHLDHRGDDRQHEHTVSNPMHELECVVVGLSIHFRHQEANAKITNLKLGRSVGRSIKVDGRKLAGCEGGQAPAQRRIDCR
ncbi:hypothetical protein B0H66DRAFT_534771 [Apodospora peruviana]|uniref:Uncharacterized protein n=1 Tax=Apodospora peruviana TaxID=516989 RepID=A0AAE0I0W7_9PEZI|nr:hypothetical protein B0H66DRAFT_534771 [Apodospora peruviana]